MLGASLSSGGPPAANATMLANPGTDGRVGRGKHLVVAAERRRRIPHFLLGHGAAVPLPFASCPRALARCGAKGALGYR